MIYVSVGKVRSASDNHTLRLSPVILTPSGITMGSVAGPQFEQICRDWVQDYAPEEVPGGVAAQVGQGVVNDPERKTAH